MLRVLVVDDDQALRITVGSTLKSTGKYRVEEAFDGQNAVEIVKKNQFDIVILDVDMPRLNGLEALRRIKEHDPSTIAIMLTAHANIDDAVIAVKEGAFNYLSKPVKAEELIKSCERALEAHSTIENAIFSAPTLMDSNQNFIGKTAEMQKIFHLINRLSKVDTPVMIRGASGTGKELVARAIHLSSIRKNEKFVAINCSAIPENLFESELFGHEKGAFTGAEARKVGKFQFADGGTLFLDELGDMPVLMQVKLLRVLQDKKFTPIGSNREISADVRIIAATNRNLEEMIKRSEFREDLFYRLNVIPIYLPNLRDRKQDIDHLTNYFINKFNKIHTRKITGLTPDTASILKRYKWPGNIRELENVIEHSFVMEPSNRIQLSSLPDKVLESVGVRAEARPFSPVTENDEGIPLVEQISASGGIVIPDDKLDFSKHKEMFEKEFIIKALKKFKGRINQTALHANIPKKTLLRKIEKYGINPKSYLESIR